MNTLWAFKTFSADLRQRWQFSHARQLWYSAKCFVGKHEFVPFMVVEKKVTREFCFICGGVWEEGKKVTA